MNGVIHAVNDVDEDVSTVIHAASQASSSSGLPSTKGGRECELVSRNGIHESRCSGRNHGSYIYNADVPDIQSGTTVADSRLTAEMQ